MAEIAATVTRFTEGLEGRITEWTPLATGDTGAWVALAEFPDRSIEVTGTFNSATVTFQGSNAAAPAAGDSGPTLNDPLGNALSFTATGLRQVLELARWVRPVVTGGTATALTVRMVSRV